MKNTVARSATTYERNHFNIRNQREFEFIDYYVTELRIFSKSCEFGDLKDSLIKDRLVCGIKQDTVRSRVPRETDLTFKEAIIGICRVAETSTQQIKAIQGMSAEGIVDIVRKKVVNQNKVIAAM